MVLAFIFTNALNAVLGALAGAGLTSLKDKLTGGDATKRRKAFDKAYRETLVETGSDEVEALLLEERVQSAFVGGLLDPARGFEMGELVEHYPDQVLKLRTFYQTLERKLRDDPLLGDLLRRYEEEMFRKEVREFIKQNPQLQPAEIVHGLNAKLHGDGAIAQDGSIAVGKGAQYIGQLVQIFIQEVTDGGGKPDENLRIRYLREVAREANLLPWAKVHIEFAGQSGKSKQFRLSDVYTDLDTTELRDVKKEAELRKFMAHIHEAKRIPAQEMIDGERKLLIMGDPGTGKSTLLKHLTYVLAQACLADDAELWLKQLQPWQWGACLPVHIELRRFAEFSKQHKQGSAAHLLAYLEHLLDDWKLKPFAPELDKAIIDEQESCLILLDGLDEVPKDQRKAVVDSVNDLANKYERHRYVVTCRPYAYIGQPWQLDKFREVTLAPFSVEQIETFVDNWYDRIAGVTLTRQEALDHAASLKGALRRPDIRGLAERPLLLTVTTQLHTFKGKLPQDRTELYAESVGLMLERWEGRWGDDKGVLDQLNIPGLKMSDLEAGLYAVAFKAHARATAEEQTADIEAGNLTHWLRPFLNNDLNKAEEFGHYIHERAGLLIAYKTDAYTFPHRTFQEFMAACHLANMKNYATMSAKLVKEDFDRWREVYILAAGYAARQKRPGEAIAAVNALCPHDVDKVSGKEPGVWQRAQLAAEALLEIGMVGVQRAETGQAVLHRLRDWLKQALLADQSLQSPDRARAGVTLARIGDPRRSILAVDAMEFCFVPAGEFMMGSNKKEDSDVYDDESPQQEMDLPAFYISRFPITNAQFELFVKASGYGEQELWTKEGWQWQEENQRTRQEEHGTPFNLPNHPVVGVSWYESLAFCNWLNRVLVEGKLLLPGYQVCLPSEAEWEKAARGGLDIPEKPVSVKVNALAGEPDVLMCQNPRPKRIYPWGETEKLDKADTGCANYGETTIGNTSAVGCFRGGASPYGCEEMSGNVWEWTRSLDQEYPYEPGDGREDLGANGVRVLRVGAYFSDANLMRCAPTASGSIQTTGTTSSDFAWYCPHLFLISEASDLCSSDRRKT